MLENTDTRLASREPPSLLLPTVHRSQGPLLVGPGPDFGDNMTFHVPANLMASLLQQPIAQGEESEKQGGVIGHWGLSRDGVPGVFG